MGSTWVFSVEERVGKMNMIVFANEVITNQMMKSNALSLQRVLDTIDQTDIGSLSFWRASVLMCSFRGKIQLDLDYMKSKWKEGRIMDYFIAFFCGAVLALFSITLMISVITKPYNEGDLYRLCLKNNISYEMCVVPEKGKGRP